MPEELLQHLLGQISGSVMQYEQVVAVVRQRLMAAEAVPAGSVTAVVVVQLSGNAALYFDGSQRPKYSGFNDIRSLEEFLDWLETFCLVNGVTTDKRLTHIVPTALEIGTKLQGHFLTMFAAWEEFTEAFIAALSCIYAKHLLKQNSSSARSTQNKILNT